jgi:hypothetical protein
MSEQTQAAANSPTEATQTNGQQAPAKPKRIVKPKSERDKASRLAHATREEAEDAKPDRGDYRLLHFVFNEAIPAGSEVWSWNTWNGLPDWLADCGVSGGFADAKPKTLSAVSDDELEAELARRKAAQQPTAPTEQPAPAPEQPAEGGKKGRGKK